MELLDSDGKVIESLTGSSSHIGTGNDGREVRLALINKLLMHIYEHDIHFQTQSHTVRFDSTCSDCTIRLERQATEWGNYVFKSCADVEIVDSLVDLDVS